MKGSGEVAGQYSDPLYAGQAGMRSAPDLPRRTRAASCRTLCRGLLQPEPCLRRLRGDQFTQAAELQLRLAITARAAWRSGARIRCDGRAGCRTRSRRPRRLCASTTPSRAGCLRRRPAIRLTPWFRPRCWLSSNHSAMRKGQGARRWVGWQMRRGAEVRVLMHIKGR